MKKGWIYIVVIGLFALQCAKQTSPTGGPKDETPPRLVKSNPKHQQTNVKNSVIELEFNEAIQLNNPREQIIITPRVNKKFETTFNKRKVTLDLKGELQENTTYSINFRDAIQDLTEKNPASVKLAFSTGSYIDSLSISGTVQDALTEKRLANYTVALVEASDTFNIFKHPASWVTVTDKKGVFSIENLKPGTYFLYAFDDRSKNLVVDSKSESYGFLPSEINLPENVDSVRLRTFKLDVTPLKLLSARTTFAYFNLRFSKSLVDYHVSAVDTTIEVHASLEPDLTTIKLYNTISALDSLQIKVSATDSLNATLDTLLYMKFPKKEATRDKFTAKLDRVTVNENNSVLSGTFEFNKPVTTSNRDSIFIQIDSLTRLFFLAEDFVWTNNQTKLALNKKVDLQTIFPPPDTTAITKSKSPVKQPQKKKPELVAAKGAFISVEKDTAQTIKMAPSLTKLEATAIIEAKVQTTENFILQLLNKSGKIVAEAINQKQFTFENLPPDTYLLRIIIDQNNNGKWDPGDYATRKEPEPIVYYIDRKGSKNIPARANWTLSDLLITY